MKNGNPVNESVMKRFFIPLSVALCALFACSCEKNEDFDGQAGSPKKTITLWAYNESYPTKTQLSDMYTQVWSPGDQIAVGDGEYYYCLETDITVPSASAGFQGLVNANWNLDGNTRLTAVYPYIEGSTRVYDMHEPYGLAYTVNCFPEQQAVEGTFAPGVFPSLAVTTNSELHFKNVFGGVVFRFSEGCEDFSAVTLHANDYGNLSGCFIYCFQDMDGPYCYYEASVSLFDHYPDVKLLAPEGGFKPDVDYYMVLSSYEFPTGFSLCFHKGDQVAIKKFTSYHLVKRSTFGILKGMNKDLTWQSESSLITSAEEEMVGQWIIDNSHRYDFGYTIPGKFIQITSTTSTEYDENNVFDFSLNKNIWGDLLFDWGGSLYYLSSKDNGEYLLYDQSENYYDLVPLEEPAALKYMGLWLEPENGEIISLNGAAVGDRTRFQTLTLFKEIADNNGGYLPIVYIDSIGAEDDYAGIDVDGKVAVVNRGDLSFSDKITNANANGAIGLIVVNNEEGSISMNVQDNDLIPAASVPLSARELLLGKTSVSCYRPATPVL